MDFFGFWYSYDQYHISRRQNQFRMFKPTLEFIEKYLQAASRNSQFKNMLQNKLSVEVLKLAKEFARFGFYGIGAFNRLRKTLLTILASLSKEALEKPTPS